MLESQRLPRTSLLKVPRQARAIETVHTVLDAAARVLAEEGAAAFNTNRVAALAGISPGSLYQYFANRDMILAALLERCVLDAETVVREILAAQHDQPVVRVVRIAVDALTAELERHARVIAEILSLAPLLAQNGMTGALETRLKDAVREFLARQPLRPLAVHHPANLFVSVNGCIYVLLKWAAERPPHISREALVDAIVRLVMAGDPPVHGEPERRLAAVAD